MATAPTQVREVARRRSGWPAAVAIISGTVLIASGLFFGAQAGTFLFAGVVALTLGVWGLSDPVVATIFLLAAMFLRSALLPQFGGAPFLLALAVLVAATAWWISRSEATFRFGAVEWAMAGYVAWNVCSALLPHKYGPGDQFTLDARSVPHFILIPTVIPFVAYVVGRVAFTRASAVRAAMWALMGFAAYSALVSVLQFTGPSELIWPRHVAEAPEWAGRAVGVVNQPVANGMVLALGIAIAALLISRRSEPTWTRWLALAIGLGCGCALYLTYTRAAWLSGLLVLVIGAVLAKGYRGGFVAVLGVIGALAVVNWATLTSADRSAGGVGSTQEVDDRLNTIATALWAAEQKPIVGWGVSRFWSVNTYHHQQWSTDTPWIRGYAIPAHQNELGILAELGVIGLALWLAVLALIAHRLWNAYRTLPADDLCGRPLVVVAVSAFTILVCTGITVDLRFFDFPLMAVFLVAGIAAGWAERHRAG